MRVLLLMLLLFSVSWAEGAVTELHPPPVEGKPLEWNGFQVSLHSQPPIARVSRNGKVVFTSAGEALHYRILLADLGGSPEPELILLADYGGTYPYHDVGILEGESGAVWYRAEGLPYARVGDFVGDGRADFALADHPVGPYKGYPTLLFKVGPGGIKLDTQRMRRRSGLSDEELRIKTKELHWPDEMRFHYNDAVALMDELIYQGRADQALELLTLGYQGTQEQRRAYWNEVVDNLRKGKYWTEILKMNDEVLGRRNPLR